MTKTLNSILGAFMAHNTEKLIEFSISKNTYTRMEKYAMGFNDTPDKAINRLLDEVEKVLSSDNKEKKPTLCFDNLSTDEFQFELINTKQAEITIFFKDGSHSVKCWDAKKLTQESNLLANIWSGPLRNWKNKGIVKADFKLYNENEIKSKELNVLLIKKISEKLNIPHKQLLQRSVNIELIHEGYPHLKITFPEGKPPYASLFGFNKEDNCYYLTEKDIGLPL